jgi:uncharacterized protein YdeI (YjbR/CyaY-like superfamily)
MSNTTSHQFADRGKWRKWLVENHSSQDGIWVYIQKKDSKEQGLRYEEAVEEAVCFGWIDGKMQSVDDVKFRQRFSPRSRNSPWSKGNKERAEKMIRIGKMTSAGFDAVNQARTNGKWDNAYSSRTVLDIPKDLEDAFKKNTVAWNKFKKSANSVKLQYIYWIESAKREETRRKRIDSVVTRVEAQLRDSPAGK